MSVDPYAICPCGSGKKIKFCCSDLVADIEKIHRMVEGDQPRAALQHAEQTLKRRPGRPSLLDLKAMLEVSLHQLDAAEKTVAELLEKDPKNPAAHAQQAILKCAQGDGHAGIEPLQHALILVGDNMPRRVLEAIGAVGHTLLMEGDVIAARAHLWLYQGIAGKDDTRALELLVRLNQVSGLPLLLRDHLYMHEAPEGHACEDDHNYAQALAARGQWGPASAVFDKLCAAHDEVATLHYNRALLHGWLGDAETFTAGLHEYARRDVPLDEAIEAEAIAQILDPTIEDARLDVVELAYPILDEEELTARISRDPHLAAIPIGAEEFNGPPPRAAYNLLDRPMPESGEGITLETAPRIVGEILQFGRQTDKSERLELTMVRDERFDERRAAFEQKVQGVVGVAQEEVVDHRNAAEQGLRWRWNFPPDTLPEVRRQLTSEESRLAVLERWPQTPLAVLGDKTPAEVADDPAMRIRLMATVATLEQASHGYRHPQAYAELREKLGHPAPAPIDPQQIDPDRLPLARVARVDAAKLSDDDLKSLYQRAAMAGASAALRGLAVEIIKRPAMEQLVDVEHAYRRLASLEEDPADAKKVIEQARERAKRLGHSTGQWDLLELEVCLASGDGAGTQAGLARIRNEHADDPQVMEQLYGMLYEMGLVTDGAGPGEIPAAAAPVAEQESSGIWTPDFARPEAGGKQKLWTPG